jgi:serine/threonine protein kinase
VTDEDIENEVKTLSAVCAPGLCKYVVEVHRHNWLPDNTHYFIDMELCDFTLEDHIREIGLGSIHEDAALIPLPPVEFGNGQKTERPLLNKPQKPVQGATNYDIEFDSVFRLAESPEADFGPDALPAEEFNWESVLDILDDITSGLLYIHSKNVVHRDLKPKNGNNPQIPC